MLKYVCKRIGLFIVSLFIIMTMLFVLIRMLLRVLLLTGIKACIFPLFRYTWKRKGGRWMRYENMVPGRFLARPNRFIARVEIAGQVETVHVKNTGRCRELLPPGAEVWCQRAGNPARKTGYDLITVHKGHRLINMDSQAPNAAAMEWLRSGGLGAVEELRAETVHGDSRFDFSFTLDGKPCFLEVKGVTLENDGICAFPDAPTERGAKHLRGLLKAA